MGKGWGFIFLVFGLIVILTGFNSLNSTFPNFIDLSDVLTYESGLWVIGGGLIFFLIGFWMLLYPHKPSSPYYR